MRRVFRVAAGLALLLLWLVVVVTVASFAFNLVTPAGNKPVSSLWAGQFVQADGVQTAYRTWGSHGTPVVLVGGFIEPTFVWNDVAPLLARSHRVYALDLDGFGYSKRRGPWTLAEWSDQVQGFMRALGVERPVVVGHSLGAAVALELARRGVVSRVVLLDGDALGSGGPPSFLRGVLEHMPFVASALRLATRWSWPVEQLLANAYGPHHPKIDSSLARRWTKQFEAEGAVGAIETMAGRKLPGLPRSTVKRLDTPATVIWGAKDSVDSQSAGRQTAADLHAPFVLIPGAGHLSMITNPGAVARAIEARP